MNERTANSALPKRRGLTIFLTGLPGAGKSTIANTLKETIEREDSRRVTLLDGDVVRQTISVGLGYTRSDRIQNIRRVGGVALEVTKAGGICVCALIAPYVEAREEIRKMCSETGVFVEIHVDTPLAECERRDPKGLYAKARAGMLKNMTGIDDPYDTPEKPEIRIETLRMSPEEAAESIMRYLLNHGLLVQQGIQD